MLGYLLSLLFCGQANAADLVVAVGEYSQPFDFSATKLTSVDFPQVDSAANLVFTVDANGWELQDSEQAVIGFSIERKDKSETTVDEYRRALMMIKGIRINGGQFSLNEDAELRGWGWKFLDQSEGGAKTITGSASVESYITFDGNIIKIDYQNLRVAVGLSAISDPNNFDWNYRLVWSSHFGLTGGITVTSDEVDAEWLPSSGKPAFIDLFENGSAVQGDFSVGKVVATSLSIELHPGWNLLVPPFFIEIDSAALAIERIESIWEGSPTIDSFTYQNPVELTGLTKGLPYWVKLSGETPLTLSGSILTDTISSISGSEWSLVSVSQESSALSMLQTVSATGLWCWSDNRWNSYLAEVPSFLNGFTHLKPGVGYYYRAPELP